MTYEHFSRMVLCFVAMLAVNVFVWVVLGFWDGSSVGDATAGAIYFAVVFGLSSWIVRSLTQTVMQLVVWGIRGRYAGVAVFLAAEFLAAAWTVGLVEVRERNLWVLLLAVGARIPDAIGYWLVVAGRREVGERWVGLVRSRATASRGFGAVPTPEARNSPADR